MYDARLFSLQGKLLVTYNCKGCDYSVSTVQLTASRTAGESLSLLSVSLESVTKRYQAERALSWPRKPSHEPFVALRVVGRMRYSPRADALFTPLSPTAGDRWRAEGLPSLGQPGRLSLPGPPPRNVLQCLTGPHHPACPASPTHSIHAAILTTRPPRPNEFVN